MGIVNVIVGYSDTLGLEATELTIPRLMKQDGYRTALFGKWHLGSEAKYNPIHHGFDEFIGFLPGGCDYLVHRDWYDGTEIAEQKGYSTDIITDRSVDFIRRNKENPFFLYIAHQAVHNYYQIPSDPPGTRGRDIPLEGEEAQARYKIMLQGLDNSVGEIMDALKELGLDENTFVFFFSDNGDVRMSPLERPYRGGKFSIYEGGHRIPAVARWPGQIELDFVKFLHPRYLKMKTDQLNKITDQLGDDHDLHVFSENLQAESYGFDKEELRILVNQTEHLRELNLLKLQPRLKQFFTAPPEEFDQKLERFFKL